MSMSAELTRDDIDDRAEAACQLLAAEPIPVSEWDTLKSELEELYRAPLR